MELVSVTEGVDYVSSILSADPPTRRLNSRETIAELLLADLGELPTVSPYLIVCDILGYINLSNRSRYEPLPMILSSISHFAKAVAKKNAVVA